MVVQFSIYLIYALIIVRILVKNTAALRLLMDKLELSEVQTEEPA